MDVTGIEDDGLEAAARRARYACLECRLAPGEVLLTAHQRDDQAETLMLQLLRGAGVHGLAAMPEITTFGAGRLARPLLPFTRPALKRYATRRGLEWIEDRSNADTRRARNYLRRCVMPLLAERWPEVARNLARSARHAAEAAEVLDEIAAADLRDCRSDSGGTLAVAGLLRLSPARLRNALRYWVRAQGLPVPSTVQLEELLRRLRRTDTLDLRELVDLGFGDFFERAETEPVHRLGQFFVHAVDFAQRAEALLFHLTKLAFADDVELPAGELGCQAHVLAPAANGLGELLLGNGDVHGPGLLVNDDGNHLRRGHGVNHVLGGILVPENDVHPLPGQLVGDRLHARAAHADAGADRVDALVVRVHRDLGADAGIARERGVDLADITGSGPAGRIVQRDVEAAKAALNAVRALGVEARNIRLDMLRLQPNRVYDDDLRRYVEKGFEATRQVVVEVHDLEKLPTLIAEIVQQGANRVNQVSYELKDRDRVRNDALREAVTNAREKAQLIIETLGENLGEVVQVDEQSFDFPRPVVRMEAMEMRASKTQAAPEPEAYAAGEIEVRASVHAVFALQD